MQRKKLNKIINYSKEIHSGLDALHSFRGHVLMVVKIGDYLAKEEKADRDIVRCAAYLHDIGLIKGDEKHEERGAKMASKFLKGLNVNEVLIARIAHCIMFHARSRVGEAETLEAKIVHDADKITTMGVFGLLRGLIYYFERGEDQISEAVDISMEFQRETFEKYIQTKTGKKVARKLYNKAKKVQEMFLDEVNMQYLK